MADIPDLSATPTREPIYPVTLEGRLDEPLSRWLWLVKWLFAIPHYILLLFLRPDSSPLDRRGDLGAARGAARYGRLRRRLRNVIE